MKAFVVLSLLAAATTVASARDQVLVDPDFGLTFETPSGFSADMVGQTPEGTVLITVATDDPALPALDPSGNICDITFQYDPSYGQGDQAWVNSLVDGTGFYERMGQEVIIPGVTEGGEDFTHHGSLAHRFHGRHEMGGAFSVSAIPSPMGFVLVTCVSSKAEVDWDKINPVLNAITMPGQPRDHLIADGICEVDTKPLAALLAQDGNGPLTASTVAALDAGREEIAANCGGLHADTLMDTVVGGAGYDGSYRNLRYSALAEIGSGLLNDEEHAALDEARQQVVATSDTGTGDRYLQYMHFIVGLRSLE